MDVRTPRSNIALRIAAVTFLLTFAAALSLLGGAAAKPVSFKLPALFSDNMVLQQQQVVPIWGWARPGQTVTVTFDTQRKAATAGPNGRWEVRLEPLKAGGPFEMTVAAAKTITLKNILVGEVWVCSGQSNMERPVSSSMNAKQEIAAARYPSIRLFHLPRNPQLQPQSDCTAKWVACSPATVAGFSAVGYYFGRKLHQDLKVPIGLIESAFGNTAAESWTSHAALAQDADLKPYAVKFDEAVGKTPHSKRLYSLPTTLYKGMIAPLIPYRMRGVIWYQGESNAGNYRRAYQYQKLFPVLIQDWRRRWNQGDFPFLFVQLANFNDPGPWAELREAQTMTLALPNTGMAVAIDVGEAKEIHPKNKQEVGRRLALCALGKTYGRKNLVVSGPLYASHTTEGNQVRIAFKHLGGGLQAKGGPLKRFAIAGADQKFQCADARIDGETILVSSPKVPQPVAVRYAWAANPEGCNLYNAAGLPASPFRTDDWQYVTVSNNGAGAQPEKETRALGNPGAEKQIAADKFKGEINVHYMLTNAFLELSDTVPEGWGLYASGDTKIRWGATDKEAHSGKSSCFLQLLDRLKKGETDALFDRILLAKSNGMSGKQAIKVEPNKEYKYAFWVKGDGPKICVEVFTWNTDEAKRAERKIAYAPDHNSETVGADWKQIVGTFKPAADARKMAVAIRILSGQPGQSIFVDDAEVSVISASRPAAQPGKAPVASRVIEAPGKYRCRQFCGYRALVIKPDRPLRDYDTVVHAELLRRGMDVTYTEPGVLSKPEALASYDLIALNVQRRFSPAQVAGLKAYLAGGGALYGAWGGPLDCPELLGMCGAKRAWIVNVPEITLAECPFSTGLDSRGLRFPAWVGDGHWGDAQGTRSVVAFERAAGVSVAQDANGNCLGIFNECGKGRTAVLGFGPGNYKFITEDRMIADALFTNLLTWLMPRGPKEHPFSNVIEINLPRRAKVLSVSLNDAAVEKPTQRILGSLRAVSIPVHDIGKGQTATVRVRYEPLVAARNIETWVCLPGSFAIYTPAKDAAGVMARMNVNTAYIFTRWCGGCDFFRPALPLAGENVDNKHAPMNNLHDFIAECHKQGVKVSVGLKVDWARYPNINQAAAPYVGKDGKADVKKVCPLDDSVQKHNVDLVACMMDQYPEMDSFMLDDNFEFHTRPCYCAQCKIRFHDYCAKHGKDAAAAGVWEEFWKAEVRGFVARVHEACAARKKRLGIWRELVVDALSYETVDFNGAMGYGFPGSTARLGLLAMPGNKGYVKMLWGMDRRAIDIELESAEAIRTGCTDIGFWIAFDKLAHDGGNWGYGSARRGPNRCVLRPGTFAAISTAFANAEGDWLDYYGDNILGGDVRFVLLAADVKANALTLKIKNFGKRAEKRVMGPVDLGPLSIPVHEQ